MEAQNPDMPASVGRMDWDFFVSYTSADRAWAEWIAWQLEKAGYRVLIQAWDFVPGAHWMTRMTDAAREGGAAHWYPEAAPTTSSGSRKPGEGRWSRSELADAPEHRLSRRVERPGESVRGAGRGRR